MAGAVSSQVRYRNARKAIQTRRGAMPVLRGSADRVEIDRVGEAETARIGDSTELSIGAEVELRTGGGLYLISDGAVKLQ